MSKSLAVALIGVVLGVSAGVAQADSVVPQIASCKTVTLDGPHKARKGFKSAHSVGFKEECVGGDGQVVERIDRNEHPEFKTQSKRRIHKSAHTFSDLP